MSITTEDLFEHTQPDAFQNNFKVTFIKIPDKLTILKALPDKLEHRIHNFGIPATNLAKYKVEYLGEEIQRIGAEMELTKELTFDIRVDKWWKTFKGFTEWRNLVLGLHGDIKAEDNKASNLRMDINISPVDDNSKSPYTTEMNWEFKGCLITGIQEIKFAHDTGDPVVVQISLVFLEMKEI